ncbi:MAG TPA: glycosyltransferase family 9 protein [Bryobacteraceae bacterium]|nr:glycosyltransferase family 9 protein [Bryobacteraceae bacterium]
MTPARILVVRLGAMGDVIHALPAVAALRRSFPEACIGWAIEPRWRVLLEANPCIDDVIEATRHDLLDSARRVRAFRPDLVVDFQGLFKSAFFATAGWPRDIYGFRDTRELGASLFYTHTVRPARKHVVDQNLELAAAAGANSAAAPCFFIPPGEPEGDLPRHPFVLANPTAGWISKQWPLEHYDELGRRLRAELGVELVLNGASAVQTPHTRMHISGLPGLIDATRRAAAVVGVDSGPMHLAAALGKPGVAIFGPTDPARNGPCGGSWRVLRSPGAVTTYKRGRNIDPSMREISVSDVFSALQHAAALVP